MSKPPSATPWITAGVSVTGAFLQLALLLFQRRYHLITDLTLNVGCAVILGLTILGSDVQAALPVFSSLPKFHADGDRVQSLKLEYAVFAMLMSLQGSLFELWYPWVVDTAAIVLSLMQPGRRSDERRSAVVEAFTGPRLVHLGVAVLVLTLLLGAWQRISLRRQRVALLAMYHTHAKAAQIRRDEQLLENVAFLNGLTLSFGFNALVTCPRFSYQEE